MSPVWAIGALACQSIVKTGWPTRYADHTQVRLKGLPMDTRDAARPLSGETSFNDNILAQLAKFGMLPVFTPPRSDEAFVMTDMTMGSGSMAYQMLISRVAHFTLLWCRDNLESDLEVSALEQEFNQGFERFWEHSLPG